MLIHGSRETRGVGAGSDPHSAELAGTGVPSRRRSRSIANSKPDPNRRHTTTGHTDTGHTDTVVALAITPDGTWLATDGDDGTARIWACSPVRNATPSPGTQGHVGRGDRLRRLYIVGSGGLVPIIAGTGDYLWFVNRSLESEPASAQTHARPATNTSVRHQS